ncbi:MAG TPA: TolC family protein [Candidatus Polarisedimenticolia bacterium]|nr:TolC family protein [Candidatus Polarisedimenticolia bacterium]
MRRRVARPKLALLMLATLLPSLAAPGAMAQEPPAAPPPDVPGGTGVQENPAGSAYVLSLQDASKAALENNLDIVVRAYDPLRSEAQVIAAEANLDPLLSGTASSSSTQRPSPSAFVRSNRTHDFLASFVDPLVTGGRYQIDLEGFDSIAETSFNAAPTHEYDTSWKVSITQPLLRNLGPRTTKSLIVIAHHAMEINQSRFRQTVMDTLSAVEKAYWDLNFALMNLKTGQSTLQLAQDFLQQNRIKVKVGTLAPIEITQAEAQVADREEFVIIAENLVKTAEDALRSVMNVPKDSPLWSQSIEPSDPLPLVEQSPDMEASVSSAQQNRPDLEQARLDLRTKETELAFRRNQRRWGLDLRGEYGKIGIGQDVPEILVSCSPGALEPDTGICLDPTFTPTGRVLEHGSYGDSIEDMKRGANLDWRVSLTLGIPIGNRQAKASYTDSQYALSQSQRNLETLELLARVQVRDAVRGVQTTLKRVKAAQVNVRLQKEKLAAEQKKFENGMSTSFQVLQFQTDLFGAASRENLALVDYNKAQVELERVQGTLLHARNVELPGQDFRRKMPFRPRTGVDDAPTVDSEERPPESARLPHEFVFDGRRLVATGGQSLAP